MWPSGKLREIEQDVERLRATVQTLLDEYIAHNARKTAREQFLKYWIPGAAATAVAVMAVGTGLHWFG